MKDKSELVIPSERVENVILRIRREKVILDADLAELFGVKTKRLNEQVKRNRDRFPEDFVFQLTEDEKNEVVANCDHFSRLRFSPVLPFAFTEHGAIMAASVLNSLRAVEMSIFVVRAFVRLRSFLASQKELAVKVADLERKFTTRDKKIIAIIDAIKQLMAPQPLSRKNPIGFRPNEKWCVMKKEYYALRHLEVFLRCRLKPFFEGKTE